MDIYTRVDLPHVMDTIRARLRNGAVAILPTDTIYGLSGNALDEDVVERILAAKQRRKPVSLVPHALAWARLLSPESRANELEAAWATYRGRFTLLWPYAGHHAKLPESVRSSGLVGLRLADHWIADLAAELGLPLVSTSVNLTQQPYMTSLDDLEPSIAAAVDFVVYEGPLYGPPSTIMHCDEQPYAAEERA